MKSDAKNIKAGSQNEDSADHQSESETSQRSSSNSESQKGKWNLRRWQFQSKTLLIEYIIPVLTRPKNAYDLRKIICFAIFTVKTFGLLFDLNYFLLKYQD